MLEAKMQEALNTQINNEMAAAYNYYAMAAWFDARNLVGFASWMKRQRTEELDHANRLFQYVLDRGGMVDLAAVDKPRSDFQNVREVFQAALEMEKQNTRAIYDLYSLAREQGDFATQSHLQWFLDEQVEEEKAFDEVSSLLDLAGDDKSALLMLDDRLGRQAAPTAG